MSLDVSTSEAKKKVLSGATDQRYFRLFIITYQSPDSGTIGDRNSN